MKSLVKLKIEQGIPSCYKRKFKISFNLFLTDLKSLIAFLNLNYMETFLKFYLF